MKLPILLASGAVLAFATGAIAQDAARPAEPNSAVTDSTAAGMPGPEATAPGDAAATAPTDTSAAASTDTSATTQMKGADTSAGASADATDATPSAADAAAAAAPAQPMATDAQSAATTTPSGALDPAKAQAADQMIAQNWSKYDAQNKGQLTPLEFGTWVLAAQGNDMGAQVEKSRHSRSANLPSTKVLNATAAEFSKADANKDRMISQDELRSYLAG